MSDAKNRTRIKICGLTQIEDVQHVASAGVDAIGLVFYARSPRNVSLERAVELAAALPAFVSLTALFMDPDRDLVERVLSEVQPELLQFHGAESPTFCESFQRRYIKAVPMGEGASPADEQMRAHSRACGFVLDSHAPGAMGGSGHTFDWTQIPRLSRPIVLAGGLHSDNVGEAVLTAQPWAVDVSSGVESAPGIKSAAKIAAFTRAVRLADQQLTAQQTN